MAVVPSASEIAASTNNSSSLQWTSFQPTPNSDFAAQQYQAWLQAQWLPLTQVGGHHPYPIWQAPSVTWQQAPVQAQPAYWELCAPLAPHPADGVQVTFLREVLRPDSYSVQVLVQSRGIQQKAWGTSSFNESGGIAPAIQAAGHSALTAAVENIEYLHSTNAHPAEHVATDPPQKIMTRGHESHLHHVTEAPSMSTRAAAAAAGKQEKTPISSTSSAVTGSPAVVRHRSSEPGQAPQESQLSDASTAVTVGHSSDTPTTACSIMPSSAQSRLARVSQMLPRKNTPASSKSARAVVETAIPSDRSMSSNSAAVQSSGAAGESVTKRVSRDKLQILAVDDEPLNLKMLHRSLTRQGHDVTLGEDGEDLVEKCIALGERFDVILLDENMRYMNGTVAAGQLRQHEQDTGIPRTTIIMTTANSGPHDVAKYHSIGVDGIVSKPMDMRALGDSLLHFKKFGSSSQKDCPSSDDSPAKAPSRCDKPLKFGELKIFGDSLSGDL